MINKDYFEKRKVARELKNRINELVNSEGFFMLCSKLKKDENGEYKLDNYLTVGKGFRVGDINGCLEEYYRLVSNFLKENNFLKSDENEEKTEEIAKDSEKIEVLPKNDVENGDLSSSSTLCEEDVVKE